MATSITGRCYCGAVRFAFDAEPLLVRACWCRDCQYLSSGNASVNVVFPGSALRLSGEIAEYRSRADSGNLMVRAFCPTCGTPLFSRASDRPDFVVVRAGALDDREIAKPQSVIWTASAPSWGLIDASVPCHAAHIQAVVKD